MLAAYETEQSQRTHRLAELRHIIDSAKQKSSNLDSFLLLVKTYTDIKELNAEIIRTLLKKYMFTETKSLGIETLKR